MGILNLLGTPVNDEPAFTTFLKNITDPIRTVRTVFIVLIGAAAIFFAIWVGIRLAKAEDEGKRKEAKQQLLWSIIAAVGAVLVLILFVAVIDNLNTGFTRRSGGADEFEQQVNNVINMIFGAMDVLFEIATIVAIIFAIYVASRLALAQDEGKRKEAKKQLLWTIIAVVGIIAISMIISSVMIALESVNPTP